ncbi:GNAT family N-acetyltransferase [Enterococcus faecalis]|uniref:GNAT family N-acetyltransferase n=1 Tax=Enterococcus faecalis TaxID=1351 RepID=UPI0001F0CE70|nr:GNAT family N-acetyltransferase [Enterococcus faecalis]EFT94986.1 acetyltransferase, GNAT family [Enterococcus faecalis TX0012]
MENLELVIKDTKELLPLEFLKIIKERVRVFVVEQNCAYQEVDDKDDTARHVYFKSNDKIVAYARITLDQNATTISFGRVLVVKEYRNLKLGKKIVTETIAEIQKLYPTKVIKISAQSYLKKMYESFGFQAVSGIYLEDDIPHISMILNT